MTCTWVRAPGGRWVVYGPEHEVRHAVETGEPVMVVTQGGRHTEVVLTSYGDTHRDGRCIGHPEGLLAATTTVRQLPTAMPPAPGVRTKRIRRAALTPRRRYTR